MFMSDPEIHELQNGFNKHIVSDWLNANKLSLDVEKNYMVYTK